MFLLSSVDGDGNYNFVIDKDGDGIQGADKSEHFAVYDAGDTQTLLASFSNPTAVTGKEIVGRLNSSIVLIRYDPGVSGNANAVVGNPNGAWRLAGEDFVLSLDKDVVTDLEIVYPDGEKKVLDVENLSDFAHENAFTGVETNFITVEGNCGRNTHISVP